jgi:hypothetical protein
VNECRTPLDPIDSEALASGDEPVFRSTADASAHVAVCPSCAAGVERARTLLASLDAVSAGSPAPGIGVPKGVSDLANRVIRIRPFSRRERRNFRLWAGPAAFGFALFGTGAGILAAPGLAARDQAGIAVALLAPLAGLARALVRAAADAAASAPPAWEALAAAARGQAALGFASLLLLLPAGFALRRVLARAHMSSASRRG